jgi:hypothetical protein
MLRWIYLYLVYLEDHFGGIRTIVWQAAWFRVELLVRLTVCIGRINHIDGSHLLKEQLFSNYCVMEIPTIVGLGLGLTGHRIG